MYRTRTILLVSLKKGFAEITNLSKKSTQNNLFLSLFFVGPSVYIQGCFGKVSISSVINISATCHTYDII